ncbi:MAG: isoprenoid biosynthesis glyoxalase ElbB [Desulfuromonadaceae bacterium]|nr:isoprenoid biosynthesis glyoxalase ElbB [Desulfuromonadaceae bacterium]
MAKKIGVVLSGCGVYDGSEIHEAVLTLLALDRAGAEIICMAPNIDQMHVVNHLTGEVAAGEKRNVLVESARIARGKIKDIKDVRIEDLDGLVIPGGFGAAKNLSDFAEAGLDCQVHREVRRLIKGLVVKGKPVAALCIAPVLIAKVLGEEGFSHNITIGNDKETAQTLALMGATHTECAVKRIIYDHHNKLITTPAYMLASRISEAAAGIEEAIRKLMEEA